MPPLNRDFEELLSALSSARARFVIVGAYAVAFHGEPRYTRDIDLLVDPTPANAERVWKALRQFGAPLGAVGKGDFATDGL